MAATPTHSARQGPLSRFRRWLATTASSPLKVFVVPGPDVLRAQGLDLGPTGLEIAHTPRTASVLLIADPLPARLAKNAAVVFAQMPRPRLLAVLGEPALGPLPAPTIQFPLSQAGLLELCATARRLLADASWSPAAQPFAPAFINDALAEQEQGGHDHQHMNHGGHGNMDHGAMDHSKMDHGQMNHDQMDHGATAQGEMDHTKMDHSQMDHGKMDHSEMNHGQPESQGPPSAAEEPMHQHEEPAGHSAPAKPTDETPVMPTPAPDHAAHHHQPPETAAPAAPASTDPHAGHAGHHQMGSEPPTPAPEPPAAGHDHAAMMKKAESKAGEAPTPPAGPPDMAGMTGMAGMDMSGDTDKVSMEMDSPADAKGKMNHDMPGMKLDDPAGAGMKMDHDMAGMDMGHDMPGMDMGHDMAGMDMSGGGMGFMSMVSMTKDLPRSADGLPMEATEAAFGPFFPGLPGGLDLRLHLDGDTVTKAVITPGLLSRDSAGRLPVPSAGFADWLADLDPLTPVAYRVLARRALAQASGQLLPESELLEQMRQLEQERIASHLNWLIGFSLTIGHAWLHLAAERLYKRVQRGTARPAEVVAFSEKVLRLPLLRGSLAGIGAMPVVLRHHARGPVARAAGQAHDARLADPLYQRLGFAPVVLAEGNAWGRMLVRLAEMAQSQALLDQIGPLSTPPPAAPAGPANGRGSATLETPRGAATLEVQVQDGQVMAFTLHDPSTRHVALANELVRELELGDALKTIASLDISPWETDR